MDAVNAKTAVTLVSVGIILIAASISLYLGKINRNLYYGFRIKKAFESEENWFLINLYGAKAMQLSPIFSCGGQAHVQA